MSVRTIKISNISPRATLGDIREFFSYSGDIEYVELESGSEVSKMAYITFKTSQGAETAQLFTGSVIIDQNVEITFAEHYRLPPAATSPSIFSASTKPRDDPKLGSAASAVKKAEDIVNAMLSRGHILGQDVINKAKAFDEKHQWTATASATVSSLDKKIRLSEKVTVGASTVSEKVKEADEKFRVSMKTKSAYENAKEKVSYAGSALFYNRFVSAGMSWVYSAFNRVSKRAEAPSIDQDNVTEQQDQKRNLEDEFGNINISETSKPEQKRMEKELEDVHPSDSASPSSAEMKEAQG